MENTEPKMEPFDTGEERPDHGVYEWGGKPFTLYGNEELTPDDVFIRTARVTGLHQHGNGVVAVCENEDADIFMELAYRPNEIYPKVGDEMIVYAVHSDKPLIIYKNGQTVK